MQLLVATSWSLLSIDPTTGCRRIVHAGKGIYYGMAVRGGHLYVAARGVRAGGPSAGLREAGEILVFDRMLKLVRRLRPPFQLRDLHQIAWVGDELWATCSYDNLIAILRPDGTWHRWYPLGEVAEPPYDRNHFNSITVDGDEVWIVAHNLGKKPSEMLCFDPVTRNLRRRFELGGMAHNLWRQGGEWLTCSSQQGELRGSAGFRLTTGGFPRGFVEADGRRYVGISTIAHRRSRNLVDGEVRVYDDAWGEVGRHCFKAEGMVCDLLVLPDDFAPASSKPMDAVTAWCRRIYARCVRFAGALDGASSK